MMRHVLLFIFIANAMSNQINDHTPIINNVAGRIVVEFKNNQFQCANSEVFIQNYLIKNPLTDAYKAINYITSHSANSYTIDSDLTITWKIEIIHADIVVKIAMDLFVDNSKVNECEGQFNGLSDNNDLILDIIRIYNFDNDSIFKIYSFQDYTQLYSSTSSLKGSLNKYYMHIKIDPIMIRAIIQPFFKLPQYNEYILQIKPFVVSILFYNDRIELDIDFVLSDTFIAEQSQSTFEEIIRYFTTDIVLHSNMKYLPETYKSNLIKFDFSLRKTFGKKVMSTQCGFSIFYQIIYDRKQLKLQYVISGSQTHQKFEIIYEQNVKKVIPEFTDYRQQKNREIPITSVPFIDHHVSISINRNESSSINTFSVRQSHSFPIVLKQF